MTIMNHAAVLSLCLLVPSAHQAFFVAPPPLLPATTSIRATTAAVVSTRTRATMRVRGIESTPNPSSFKFDLDQSLAHRSGTAGATKGFTYSSTGAAADQQAPEAIRGVLELQGVESVYALGDWLCVNKKPSAKWDAIVPAAVEALGGPAESLDPLTLLMASGGDGGSAWQRSEMDGIAIRLQVSNGIPIQVEACPPGGTPLRRKLSSRFVDAMTDFVSGSGDEMAFFKGRQWIPRGVRYPSGEGEGETEGAEEEPNAGTEPEGTSAAAATKKVATSAEKMATAAEEALSSAAEEVELAFHESRLRGAVDAALHHLKSSSEAAAAVHSSSTADPSAAAPSQSPGSGEEEAKAAVRRAASTLQQAAEKGQIVGAVDALCALAENDGPSSAKDALDALMGFAASGDGPVAARRAAVAFIGGAGDAAGPAGLEAVAAVFRGDKSPGVRRTAGDALSDLGNPAAVPIATAGLWDKSKLVRWRAARVVGELASREQDAVSLDEAREGEGEFEVAFEMSDAARKIRARVAAAAEGGDEGAAVAGVGPVWKQIQERGL